MKPHLEAQRPSILSFNLSGACLFLLAWGGLIHNKHTAMKHILPVLTVSALAAAASAQTAPAPSAKQALSYNRVIASYVTNNSAGEGDKGVSIFAQAKIGGGLYVSGLATDLKAGDNDSTTAALGYAYSLPSILGVSSDLNIEVGHKSVGASVRALIGGGIEIDLGYAHGAGSDLDDTLTIGASYNLGFLVKGLSLNAAYASQTGGNGFDTTSVGIGYNF